MAISNQKIINYSIVEKNINSNKFIKFIAKINKNNFCYFMDNAIIHKSKKFNIFKNNNNLNVIYNAPYHSEFNPIENIFSMLRNEILRNNNSDLNKIIKIINNFKININPTKISNIYKYAFNNLNNF